MLGSAFSRHAALLLLGNDKHILIDNCLLNGVQMPNFSAHFYNLHGMAREAKIDGAHLCSGELASHLGVGLHGHIHNALYDVRSIAPALNQWMQKGLLKPSLFHTKKTFINYY
ncbi:hypothetical protein CXF95_16270 [Paraglaciecola sp. MB-3u-78]|nr:hypothetical protein CXF95_16270 [Paraglaciecola sp. MB-3u-78]